MSSTDSQPVRPLTRDAAVPPAAGIAMRRVASASRATHARVERARAVLRAQRAGAWRNHRVTQD